MLPRNSKTGLVVTVSLTLFLTGLASATKPKLGPEEKNEIFIRRDNRKSLLACPERDSEAGLSCPKNCTKDEDCFGPEVLCKCFKECGLSCLKKQKIACNHPGLIRHGRVVQVGLSGLYDLRFGKEKVPSGGHVVYECDPGFGLAEGPPGKVCKDGVWEPQEAPICVNTSSPTFTWVSSGRIKRRAIKTGGSSSIVRSKTGPGGNSGGLGTRRTKKKLRYGDDDDAEVAIIICPNLDHDEYIQTEVIQHGSEHNETFSEGAVVKVSCKPGFGVNLPNETVICDRGRWRPKIPQCSALPCSTPYIMHGVFYEGAKPLYFQEAKKHKTMIDVKCLRGYKLWGPAKLHCWFGEWDIAQAPECIPAPCRLPHLESGSYHSFYQPNQTVLHGTEVDFSCSGSYKKLASGPARCDLGEWKPQPPFCFHPGISSFDKKRLLQPMPKNPCGKPQKMKLAHTFVNGLPMEWDKQASFPDGTDLLYRCNTTKAGNKKNRFKLSCENGTWVSTYANMSCDPGAPPDKWMNLPDISMINGSCIYKRSDAFVITFHESEVIVEDSKEFPHGTVLTSRCVDIGKFRLDGAVRRKCLSGQWMGITPKCSGLSQYEDYALDKPPTILLRYKNGSIVQSEDGNLVVFPGTTLHLECLWLRKFGKPTWSTSISKKVYAEGWAEEEGRDNQLEYRLTIANADKEDDGRFACKTPTRHTHEINVIVKEAWCPPLPDHPDLIYSGNDTILGTRVTFTCRLNNSLIGASELFCSDRGKWSAPLPRCENIECPDISILPALAPLARTSVTKNGTLGKNETAPPRVSVLGTHPGGKATFSCEQGYMIEGSEEATCQPNGEWSSKMPLCKEVECPPPPVPDNAVVQATPKKKYKAGDFANFECQPGYMMEGPGMLACQDNGMWSKPSGIRCKVGCPYPGAPISGTVLSQIKFFYEVGEVVEFGCDGGVVEGSRRMVCQKNGQWSNSIPTCVSRN